MPFIVTITRITHNMPSPQYFTHLIRAVACYVMDAAFTRKKPVRFVLTSDRLLDKIIMHLSMLCPTTPHPGNVGK